MDLNEAGWVHDMYEHLPEEDLALGREALTSGATGESVPKVYMRGRGSKFWTSDGMEVIDCTSQAWSLGVGACHPKIIEAVKAQLDYFTHVRTNFDTPPKLILSKKLAEVAPGVSTLSPSGTTIADGLLPRWMSAIRINTPIYLIRATRFDCPKPTVTAVPMGKRTRSALCFVWK